MLESQHYICARLFFKVATAAEQKLEKKKDRKEKAKKKKDLFT